jgi:hypothetical protein
MEWVERFRFGLAEVPPEVGTSLLPELWKYPCGAVRKWLADIIGTSPA